MAKRSSGSREAVALKSYEYFPDKRQNTIGEYIPTPNDYRFMGRAIKKARMAIGKDMPIGAVAWHPRTNRTWETHAMDHITGDSRKHSEDVMLDLIFESIRESNFLSALDLSEFVLYVTLRPCGRCAQSWSDHHAPMILYGAVQEEVDTIRTREVTAHDIWADAGRRLTVVEGLLAEESKALLVRENLAPGRA